jgi:N-methylhydantoinase A/oxoprolinase/acetone carboxylase beta subunit
MGYFLGVDTGCTYTDAVILDEAADLVIGSAKSLTTRGDLALGIGRAVDAALYRNYHGQDSKISGLLGKCGLRPSIHLPK